jgi:GntR family transcriptional repressor for pyruvate dehydrogenase complex
VLAALFQSELSIGDFRRLDREFHTTIALACRNPLLIELYGKVLDQLFRSQEFDALLNSEQNRSKVERIVTASSAAHALIAAAFASRDSAAMREASEAHLAEVEQAMIADLV